MSRQVAITNADAATTRTAAMPVTTGTHSPSNEAGPSAGQQRTQRARPMSGTRTKKTTAGDRASARGNQAGRSKPHADIANKRRTGPAKRTATTGQTVAVSSGKSASAPDSATARRGKKRASRSRGPASTSSEATVARTAPKRATSSPSTAGKNSPKKRSVRGQANAMTKPETAASVTSGAKTQSPPVKSASTAKKRGKKAAKAVAKAGTAAKTAARQTRSAVASAGRAGETGRSESGTKPTASTQRKRRASKSASVTSPNATRKRAVTERPGQRPGGGGWSLSVDRWVRKTGAPARILVDELRRLIRGAAPSLDESIKWSQPVYCGNQPVCYLMARAEGHVTFGFWRGVELPDPQGILEGSGSRMRHVNVERITDVPRSALSDLVRAAVELDASAQVAGQKFQ
ncbi:MAG: DUF1801 domain-containing protein [Myxococcales bacterium FL481]|nr:MAG: DUF1801 domain-containing protein [Myxococcales bacterium FL481]